MSRPRLRRLEVIAAWFCALALVVALASGGFPDSFFGNGLIVALLTIVAGCLFVSWLFLFFLHVYRIAGRWEYSFAKAFVVLFVPVVGVIWLSIKGVTEKPE